MVCVALLNFTALTDITDHDILLKKLECHGFNQFASLCMKISLKNRKTIFVNSVWNTTQNVYDIRKHNKTVLKRTFGLLNLKKKKTMVTLFNITSKVEIANINFVCLCFIVCVLYVTMP